MTFNILEHIEELDIIEDANTQYTIVCPICLGKIRISKRNGAYRCVGAQCETYLIRRELGFDCNYQRNYFFKPHVEPLPIPLAKPIVLHECDTTFDVKKSSFIKEKEDGEKYTVIQTIYEYDETHQIVRLDYPDSNRKKDFYPWRFDEDRGRFVSMGDSHHPFFNRSLIKDSSKYVLFVEGEKNAIEISQLGLLALTLPSFCYSVETLENVLKELFYEVKGIIVVPDNDTTGYQKASRVRNACWKVGISCLVLNFNDYYEKENDDLVDLMDRGIDVKNLLLEKVNDAN